MLEQFEGFLRTIIREEVRSVVQEGRGGSVADMLTVQEAAQLAHVHVATVRNWVRGGQLNAHGTRRMARIKRADLLALLERGPAPRARVGSEMTPEEAARVMMAKAG